jgi:hypothetical protein
MSQADFLKGVAGFLESAGVKYLLTGSFASSIQGEPRLTHDVDLVVAMSDDAVRALIKAFPPPRYYLDEKAAIQAVHARRMFNLLDTDEGDKVDFWMLTGEPFDRSRMERRQQIEAFGMHLWVSSPEDTILMKLKWAAQSGGSERQFRDAKRVYELQKGGLDSEYLEKWADTLGVTDSFRRLVAEAGLAGGSS